MKYLLLVLMMMACESVPVTPDKPEPTPSAVPTVSAVPTLSWEAGHPERKEWSKIVYDLLSSQLFDVYDSAKDNEQFCPKFKSLTKEQQAHVWSEMWVWVAYHESGWDPKSKYLESFGYNSEGLLQLSYVDKEWAPYCEFPIKQDAKESILDPGINLRCGLKIMGKQIEKYGHILVDSGVYWAVLKLNGRYQKIKEITDKTKQLSFCK